MSKHYMLFYTYDSNVKDWGDLTPDKIHHIEFKGKLYNEVCHGQWLEVDDDSLMHRCSVCGELSCCCSPYCGECGASMDEGEDK